MSKKDNFKKLIQGIVEESSNLKDKYTEEKNVQVNYACVFSQNDKEYQEFYQLASDIGQIVKQTDTGDLFKISGLDTVAGHLRLLKIRRPDNLRPERGDADFTVLNYGNFKNENVQRPGFKLIQRPNIEMIELSDPLFNVLTYFSYPPLDQQLGLK